MDRTTPQVPIADVISVDPFRCRLWDLHDRFEEHLREESCRALIESVAKHGQLVPALGRYLRGDPHHDIELVCGARRLFIARHLKRPLRVEVRPLSDREALIAMDAENRHREDLSPYERAVSYMRWMRAGHFASQEELSKELRISRAQVSRLLKIARMPALLVAAFERPSDLQESWGIDLMNLWDDGDHREALCRAARRIAARKPRPPARLIYRELLAAGLHGAPSRADALHAQRDDVVRDRCGNPLFRVKRLQRAVVLCVPHEILPVGALDSLKERVAQHLEAAREGASKDPESS